MIKTRWLLACSALAALAIGAAAFASGSAVPVGLKLVGSPDRNVGDSATLTATAKLPAGAHLLVNAFRGGKSVAAKVRECLRSPCTTSFRDTVEENVQFQALAIKRSGKKMTVLGRSPRVTVGWTEPAPPPPPPPAATPGHYAGKTADNELFAFDIGADGLSLTNLQTGQMNQSCNPSDFTLYGGDVRFNGPIPVAADGTFTLNSTFAGVFADGDVRTPTNNVMTITGHVSGGIAAGTYREETSFTLPNGAGYNCSTGNQTWTAAKA